MKCKRTVKEDMSKKVNDVEIYSTGLSVLQKFEMFFEKIPHDSSIAFDFNQRYDDDIPLFVKALLRHLGRKPPIDANYDQDIVQTWLSNNESRRDLVAHLSTFGNTKAEFIINLSSYSYLDQISAARNATSKYSYICLPFPSTDERYAMTFLSSEEYNQSDKAYSVHWNNMEKYWRRTECTLRYQFLKS